MIQNLPRLRAVRLPNNQQNSQLGRIVGRINRLSAQLNGGPSMALQVMVLLMLEDLIQAVATNASPTYKTEFVNATAAGNTEVVERVVDRKIQVVAYTLNNGAASVATVHFRSGSRAISSDKDLAADGGGMVVPIAQAFWFETAVGEALNINLAAAGAVGVDVTYVEAEA